MKIDMRYLGQCILPRIAATAGIVAALAVSWWMRVENAREKDSVPIVALGIPIDLGQTMLTPLSLTLSQGDDAQHQLILRALAENRTGETQSGIFGFPAKPPDIQSDQPNMPELGPPEVFLNRDAEALVQLHSRMSEEINVVWTFPQQWQPNQLSMTFFRQNFKLRDNLYGQANWLTFAPEAQLVATVDKAL